MFGKEEVFFLAQDEDYKDTWWATNLEGHQILTTLWRWPVEGHMFVGFGGGLEAKARLVSVIRSHCEKLSTEQSIRSLDISRSLQQQRKVFDI